MKRFLLAFTMLASALMYAQKDCDYTVDSTKEGTDLKITREYLMHEKVFGNSSQFVFFALANSEGTPILNFQLLAKSKDFPKLYCIDKNSRIYLQLTNGKVVTLMSAEDNVCGSLVYDSAEKNNIRILSGAFLFTKGSPEELKNSPIMFIRVKYTTETVDYPVHSEINSETMKATYYPQNYFIDYLKCIL